MHAGMFSWLLVVIVANAHLGTADVRARFYSNSSARATTHSAKNHQHFTKIEPSLIIYQNQWQLKTDGSTIADLTTGPDGTATITRTDTNEAGTVTAESLAYPTPSIWAAADIFLSTLRPMIQYNTSCCFWVTKKVAAPSNLPRLTLTASTNELDPSGWLFELVSVTQTIYGNKVSSLIAPVTIAHVAKACEFPICEDALDSNALQAIDADTQTFLLTSLPPTAHAGVANNGATETTASPAGTAYHTSASRTSSQPIEPLITTSTSSFGPTGGRADTQMADDAVPVHALISSAPASPASLLTIASLESAIVSGLSHETARPETTSIAADNPAEIVVGGVSIAAISTPQYVVSGQTLVLGSSITIGTGASTTVIALQTGVSDSRLVLILGTSTSTLSPVSTTAPPQLAPSFLVGSVNVAPDSRGEYIIGAQTLTPGKTLVVSGTTYSLAPGASDLVVGTSTALRQLPPAFSVGSMTFAPNSRGEYVIGTQTLTPGAALVVSGTTYSLAAGASELVVGTSTALHRSLPSFLVGTVVVAPNSRGEYIIGTQTLTPGAALVVSGTTYSLAAGASDLVVGTSTAFPIPPSSEASYIWDRIQGAATVSTSRKLPSAWESAQSDAGSAKSSTPTLTSHGPGASGTQTPPSTSLGSDTARTKTQSPTHSLPSVRHSGSSKARITARLALGTACAGIWMLF